MRGTIKVESHYHYYYLAVSIVAVPTLAASALEWFSLTGKVGWSIDPRTGPPDSHLAAKQNTTSRASGIPYYAYCTAIIPSTALSARWLGWIVAGMQNDDDAVLSFFFGMCCAVQYVVHTPFCQRWTDLQYQLAVVATPITAISRLPIPRLSGWSVRCSSGNLTESGPGPYSNQARESRSGLVYHVLYSTSSDLTSRTTISPGLRGLGGPLDLGLGGFQVPVSEVLYVVVAKVYIPQAPTLFVYTSPSPPSCISPHQNPNKDPSPLPLPLPPALSVP
jgi:hypothetical protein